MKALRIEPSAIRPIPRGVLSVLVVLALLATVGIGFAHRHTIADSEMRDLRNLARGVDLQRSSPVVGFTAAELRDLRAEARSAGGDVAFGVSTVSLTLRELQDLRQEAKSAPTFENRATFTPVRAFTESELRDLRALARMHGLNAAAGFTADAR